jgi:hypothetical protein
MAKSTAFDLSAVRTWTVRIEGVDVKVYVDTTGRRLRLTNQSIACPLGRLPLGDGWLPVQPAFAALSGNGPAAKASFAVPTVEAEQPAKR